MSDNYIMVRDFFIKRVKRRFIFFMVATYWSGFWCFYLPHMSMSEGVNKEGQTLGLYDLGFATQMCFVILNHALFMTVIRDWTKIMRIMTSVTLVLYILVMGTAHNMPGGSPNFYKHMLEVLTLPIYWLSLIPTIAIGFIPYYLERAYWQLWRFPKFFQN